MKVTAVTTSILAIPQKELYYYSQGVGRGVNCVLVRIETDEGITGIGEGCGDRSAEAIAAIMDEMARALIGKSLGDSVEVTTPGGSKSYEIIQVDYK